MSEEQPNQPRVKELAFQFAVSLIRFLRAMPPGVIERELVRQLFRAGASIGANIEEAEGARTKPEFVNSMNIAKGEARETVYWIRLLLRMLTAIVKTSHP